MIKSLFTRHRGLRNRSPATPARKSLLAARPRAAKPPFLPGLEDAPESIELRTEIPGPESRRLAALRAREIPAGLSNLAPLFIREGRGALLTDVDGNTFIDFAGGIGSLNVGHRHPEVLRAIEGQARRYLHACFHVAMQEPYLELASKLNRIVPIGGPLKTAFFNTGAEAVENAVKLARRFTGRPAVVALESAFHGRTLLALTLTSKAHPYKAGFGPLAPEVYRLPIPDLYHRPYRMSARRHVDGHIEALQRFFKLQVEPERVAAVILELQSGEGGFTPLPVRYVQALQQACRTHGILLIDDEVQTGFARTGSLFACGHYGLEPDLVTMAKSLGGGMPLAAVTGRAAIMDSAPPGGIGTTFGGHPLACAAALASLEVIEKENLCRRARLLGKRLKAGIRRLSVACPHLGEVRGLGAMVGIEFVENRKSRRPAGWFAKAVVKNALEQGLLLLACGTEGQVVRTLMPLTITDRQFEDALAVLELSIKSAMVSPGGRAS
jgi:4-aminobutyrate aminotransferase/(S)-3-amino-2-methylpropionate transaminase